MTVRKIDRKPQTPLSIAIKRIQSGCDKLTRSSELSYHPEGLPLATDEIIEVEIRATRFFNK
jgi:hypothetical protein